MIYGTQVFAMNVSEKQIRQGRFWRKFLRLTRAGVPVIRTLEVVGQEEENERFAKVIRALLEDVENGTALAAALTKFPSEFSPSVVEMIKTAEKRGAWDEVVEELSEGLLEGTFE